MYKIDTYFLMPRRVVDVLFHKKLNSNYSGNFHKDFPECCYVHISDAVKVKELIKTKDLEPRNVECCIVIKNSDETLLGFGTDGLDFWNDILYSLQNLLTNSVSDRILGIDYLSLRIEIKDNKTLEWKIYNESEDLPNQIYYSATVDSISFIQAIVTAGKDYYETMHTYFPEELHFKEKKEMLQEIGEQLQELWKAK